MSLIQSSSSIERRAHIAINQNLFDEALIPLPGDFRQILSASPWYIVADGITV